MDRRRSRQGDSHPSSCDSRFVISILTPAFNEAANLPRLYDRVVETMRRVGGDWEWVIVDDHSRDETFAVIEALALRDARVRGFRLARNSGSPGSARDARCDGGAVASGRAGRVGDAARAAGRQAAPGVRGALLLGHAAARRDERDAGARRRFLSRRSRGARRVPAVSGAQRQRARADHVAGVPSGVRRVRQAAADGGAVGVDGVAEDQAGRRLHHLVLRFSDSRLHLHRRDAPRDCDRAADWIDCAAAATRRRRAVPAVSDRRAGRAANGRARRGRRIRLARARGVAAASGLPDRGGRGS
ncbi:MAG: hypothetical protein DMF88_07300 [Acidobacteria bacterium]|nr:MAG: hypothetical protein DMF88_07300 [Acidobacteriota bacterium]